MTFERSMIAAAAEQVKERAAILEQLKNEIPHTVDYHQFGGGVTVSNPYDTDISSFAEKRFDAVSGIYRSFLSSHHLSENGFKIDTTNKEYSDFMKNRPIVFCDANMRIASGEKVHASRFFCFVYQSNDPIESIIFYDNAKGGGHGISGGKELAAGVRHEIKVQTTVDGQQFVDLSFAGGDAQFTLFTKTKSGLFSNPAILYNGKNAVLAGK